MIVLKNKQERQCRCNVKLTRLRATIFAVEKQGVKHIVSACL